MYRVLVGKKKIRSFKEVKKEDGGENLYIMKKPQVKQ